jgi:hypothetical protein
MTQKNTKEPWFCEDSEVNANLGDIQTTIADCFNHANAGRTNANANAQRIVSCINACAGLTNEQLASGYIQKLLRDNKECKKIIHDINETTIRSLNELIKRQVV